MCILSPVNNQAHGDFRVAYLDFHLMIENTGQKNAIIDRFGIEITELGINQDNLRPLRKRTKPFIRSDCGVA
jgi:hypothetical protein